MTSICYHISLPCNGSSNKIQKLHAQPIQAEHFHLWHPSTAVSVVCWDCYCVYEEPAFCKGMLDFQLRVSDFPPNDKPKSMTMAFCCSKPNPNMSQLCQIWTFEMGIQVLLFPVFISLSKAKSDCYVTGSLTSRNTIRNIKEKFWLSDSMSP